MHIHSLLNPLPTTPSHPSRSPQSTKLSSLCYTAGSHQRSILHTVVFICQSSCPNICLTHPFPPFPHVCSLHLCLYSCPANRLICKIFLDCIHGHCVVQSLSCVWLFWLHGCSTPGFPVLHHLLEFAQAHVHWISDAIQTSHSLSSPSPAVSLFHQQGLFQWVNSLHQVATVLELQLWHQSFQWIFGLISFRIDWLELLVVHRTLKSLL